MVCVAASGARAEGLFDFFNALGGGNSQQAAPIPQPGWVPSDAPPLTVRAHRKHHVASSGHHGGNIRYNVADLKGITIYTDKTLARGDAVMTPTGLKVFNGSSSWPYRDDDFVAVADSGKMTKDIRKELVAIDGASKPALQR